MNRGLNRVGNDELLLLLGEELKQPLISISQLSEIHGYSDSIGAHASRALRSIDNTLLYRHIHTGQIALKLEPVHIGSTINDVANTMQPLMRAAGCRTDIKIQRTLSPVDVDRQVLQAALQGMWQALIGTVVTPAEVVCKARRTKGGIRLSLMSSGVDLKDLSLGKANIHSSQPLSGLAGPAADILTAHGMFEILGSTLTKTVGKSQMGFGVTLKTSKQLQLI